MWGCLSSLPTIGLLADWLVQLKWVGGWWWQGFPSGPRDQRLGCPVEGLGTQLLVNFVQLQSVSQRATKEAGWGGEMGGVVSGWGLSIQGLMFGCWGSLTVRGLPSDWRVQLRRVREDARVLPWGLGPRHWVVKLSGCSLSLVPVCVLLCVFMKSHLLPNCPYLASS